MNIRLILFRFVSLVIAMSVAVLFIELVLICSKPLTRIYCPAGKMFESLYVPDTEYVYGLKPDTVYAHFSYYGDFVAKYRINSEGLRADRNYGFQKPDGVKRILILGDS